MARYGYTFGDEALLAQALTHRSAGRPNNERLEFFGDSLLNLIVSEHLYQRFPQVDEGSLTRLRSVLVRESALADAARSLQLGDHLRLGPGELKSGGHRRESILADALEALVAAVYLDGGFDAARSAVLRWMEPALEQLTADTGKDAKTRLQEYLQARQWPLPHYKVVAESGQEHEREFVVQCSLESPALQAQATATSRRAAEQLAAERVLVQMEKST